MSMTKSSWAWVAFAGTLGALLVVILCGRLLRSSPADGSKFQTIGELAATRPAPDLTHLAQRSDPAVVGREALEPFWDILKLRSGGGQDAVPVLTKILVSNAATGRIHGYAAAQALFCIGGKEATQALDQHLFELGEYSGMLGAMYVDHWNMAEPQRSPFIEAYLLKSIGREIELAVVAREAKAGAIELVITVRNASAAPVELLDPPNRMLYVRGKSGRFLVRRELGFKEDRKRSANWVTLKPGEMYTATESATVQIPKAVRKLDPHLPKNVQLVLQTDMGMFYVDEPGDYEVVMVIEQTPAKGWAAMAKRKHPWVGRAVSKPILLRLTPPEQ